MRRRLLLLWIALGCLFVAVLAVGLTHQAEPGGAAAVSPNAEPNGPTIPDAKALGLPAFTPFPLPAVSAPAIDGRGVVSLAALRGRPVLINFWASWCGPCRREAPELRAFAAAHPEVSVVGVNADHGLAPAVAFARSAGWTWPSAADGEAGPIQRRFRVAGLPQTFFVDRGGRVVQRIPLQTTRAQLEALARRYAT